MLTTAVLGVANTIAQNQCHLESLLIAACNEGHLEETHLAVTRHVHQLKTGKYAAPAQCGRAASQPAASPVQLAAVLRRWQLQPCFLLAPVPAEPVQLADWPQQWQLQPGCLPAALPVLCEQFVQRNMMTPIDSNAVISMKTCW